MQAPHATRWRALPDVRGVHVLLSDSVTVFDAATAAGAIVVSGSHGGASALAYVIRAGVQAVVVNDAGVGKDAAGIAGLALASSVGLAAVAVAHTSARIGDGEDTLRSGVVSHANDPAAVAGVRAGMTVSEAVEMLAATAPRTTTADTGSAARAAAIDLPPAAPPVLLDAGPPPTYAIDSAVGVDAALTGAIVVTGSHGGAAHGRALDARVAAAFFNDAGVGKERAGVGRLPILEADGIPGVAVGHGSARIGEAMDTWHHGIVSVVNGPAAAAGVAVGQRVREAACIVQLKYVALDA